MTGHQQQTLETYLDESLDPILEALETMQSQRTKDSTKTAAALKAVSELETKIQSIAASEKELLRLSGQQQKLGEQLKSLAQTTVGTKEYDQAQRAVAETISSLVNMLTDMAPSMKSIQKTLGDLAAMYRATLEVAKHPVKLSDESAKSVSRGLTRQLTTSLSSDLRPLVNESFKSVQDSLDSTVNAAVNRLERERARLSKELEKVTTERQKLAEAIQKDTERMENTKRFALWVIIAALLVGAGLTAIGALGVGVMQFLGLPDGVGTLWGHVTAAETWYSTVGWLAVTLGTIGLIVSPMVYVASKLAGDD
ncbi:hypothetical protein CAMM_02715 [Corynebacterium ammoniagenes DSM 20306]|nr:hypothetical protein CAMM_02715 [Corynebacterium ammoniagenes DSM 20306]